MTGVADPLVTVIALCFNHSRFVIECLESIRQQSYKNIQLIIMDDCSSDNSVELIKEWIEDNSINCTFIPHKSNVGICKTLNEAISYASADYIAMTATDDIWFPEKLEEQVSLMNDQPDDVGVLYSDAVMINENGEELPGLFIDSHRKFSNAPEGNIFGILVEGNFIPAMTTLIRRSVYTNVGLYDERLSFEDWDMWLRISRQFKFVYSPFVSAKYRIVSGSLIRTLLDGDPDYLISFVFIIDKFIDADALDPIAKAKLKKRITRFSKAIYRSDAAHATECLLVVFKRCPRFRTMWLYCCASGMLPCRSMRRYYSKAHSYLRWRISFFRS